LQYRAAALAGVATQFAWGFMLILAHLAFARANPAAYPMEFSQTVSYLWIQQAFLSLFAPWVFDGEIFAAITSGDIAYELVRPMDLYGKWFCHAAASRLARTALRCLPIFAVAFFLPPPFAMALPADLSRLLLFLASAALAWGVVVAFSLLVYALTFYTLSPVGLQILAVSVVDFLAGGIVPLPFFPEPFRGAAEWLPFAAMQNMPLRVYGGGVAGVAAARGLGLQVFWLCALVALGRLLMARALRKVVVQGG
jgi:ABC-2 type transport system permease protein